MKRKVLIWLDDCRDPFAPGASWIKAYSPIGTDVDVIWYQTFDEFENHIEKYGLPDAICFDHDLEEDSYDDRTGYDAAKLVVDYCMNNNVKLPKWNVQSSNPVGANAIRGYLNNFEKYYEK